MSWLRSGLRTQRLFRLRDENLSKCSKETISAITGNPVEMLSKQAVISYEGKPPNQNSWARTDRWVLTLPVADARWRNPVMGWSSTNSTTQQIRLHFPTLEAAKDYCEQNGIDRIDANERKHEHPVNVNVHNRTYSDNFAYKRPKTNLYDD